MTFHHAGTVALRWDAGPAAPEYQTLPTLFA